MIDAGIIDTPLRLVHNFTGNIIGMSQIMLPFLVLPLYASMKVDRQRLCEGRGEFGRQPGPRRSGACSSRSRCPGCSPGCCWCSSLSLGFFVTPVVLGGGRIIMVAMRIEKSISLYSNWGAASALAVILLMHDLDLSRGRRQVPQARQGHGRGRTMSWLERARLRNPDHPRPPALALRPLCSGDVLPGRAVTGRRAHVVLGLGLSRVPAARMVVALVRIVLLVRRLDKRHLHLAQGGGPEHAGGDAGGDTRGLRPARGRASDSRPSYS